MSDIPVLCVPGIWDDTHVFDPLATHLRARGHQVTCVPLTPNDGSAGIRALADQVETAVTRTLHDTGAARVDLVGFSMGALVSRVALPTLRGQVRRFISISGPHAGSWLAYLGRSLGALDMRPNSPLLRSLDKNVTQLGIERAFCFRTPFDLMVVPSKSACLEGATERTFPVLLHPWMLSSRDVLNAVAEALTND